ncbi:MAG: lipopolysaccharide biosynthesis protein [Deltaproteobacteria bacterium]|nr:lipopolysaccharide biosynthesis protein [Deltaproteobacteria bacterium]
MPKDKINQPQNDVSHTLNNHESISRKVIRGGIWVFSLRIVNRGLGFIRTVILARLLAPEDFGLFGIAMLSISTLETFSQTGFQLALIQKKENVKSYLDTAWSVSVIRGLILFLILFLSAPLIALFFDSPQATLMIRFIALSTLFSGLKNIGILYFQKELEFNKQFKYEFFAIIVDLMVSISLAFLLKNVWALISGWISANIVRCFMSYMIHPYRPKFDLKCKEFHELYNFGKWIISAEIIIFLITKGDDILVGKMLGVTALGFYQMAYLFSNLPATEITHIISRVTFPAYSKFQDDLLKLKEAYLKVIKLTAFISIPLSGFIFIFSQDFTSLFLGSKWLPFLPALKILCIFGATRALNATTGPIFYAMGKPEILTKISTVQLIILMLIIYPLTNIYKLIGVSFAVTFSNLICSYLSFKNITYMTNITISRISKIVLIPTLITCIIMGAVYSLKTILASHFSLFFNFSFSLIFGLSIYLFFVIYLSSGSQTFMAFKEFFRK